MDGRIMDYLMDRMDSRRGVRGSGRSDNASHDRKDYRDGYEDGYEDGRRGVRGSGRGDNRDNRDNSDSRDNRNRYEEGYRRDGNDMPKLSKSDMQEWKRMLENMDGTRGPHYDMQQIINACEKSGVKIDLYDEKEFCLVVNWLYSDYCKAMKKHVSSDEILHLCIDMAKDFFEDPDGPDPELKLALIYHCVINV